MSAATARLAAAARMAVIELRNAARAELALGGTFGRRRSESLTWQAERLETLCAQAEREDAA